MHILSASVLAALIFAVPVAGSAAPGPMHVPQGGADGLVQPVAGWWEQQRRPDEPRQRYERLQPNMRGYYDMLETRIETLDGWRGGDLRRRNPAEFRLISDLIDQMRREQYSILQYRYQR